MQLTSTMLLVLGVPLFVYLTLIVPTLIRLFKGTRPDEISLELLLSFSPSIYLPMERLMNGEDFTFLSSQPGFDLSLYRKLRRDRLKIFRQYLNRMIVDFNRLHCAARVAVSQSAGDHSSLLSHLIVLKLRFTAAVLTAEFRCTLCFLGVQSLSAKALLVNLEELNAQFQAVRLPV